MKIDSIIMTTLFCLLFSCSKEEEKMVIPIESVPSVTYTNFAKRIFDTYCISCHSATGSPLQFPLLSNYNEVKLAAFQGRLQARVIDKTPSQMPPFTSLSQFELNEFQKWLDQGALE